MYKVIKYQLLSPVMFQKIKWYKTKSIILFL